MANDTLAELFATDFGNRNFIMKLMRSYDVPGYTIVTGTKNEIKSEKFFPYTDDLTAYTRFISIVKELEDIVIEDAYDLWIGDKNFGNEYWVAQDYVEGHGDLRTATSNA